MRNTKLNPIGKCPQDTQGTSSATAKCELKNTNYRVKIGAKTTGNQSDVGLEGKVGIGTSNSIIQPFSYGLGSNVQKGMVI